MLKQPTLEQTSFNDFKKNETIARQFAQDMWVYLTEIGWTDWFMAALIAQSRVEEVDQNGHSHNSEEDDPSQGLIETGYEETWREGLAVFSLLEENPELFQETIHAWLYYLFLLNHPEMLAALHHTAAEPFQPPEKKKHPTFEKAEREGAALTIEDLVLEAGGETEPRVSRTQVFLETLQLSYWRQQQDLTEVGRRQARSLLVVGDNPEISGSAFLTASMAATHHLVGLPRDGVFKNIDRQAALAKKVMEWLERMPTLMDKSEEDRTELLDWYRHNVMGVVESVPEAACLRAAALYAEGVRTFRVYSPEPNSLLVGTVTALRQLQQDNGWEPIEIFAGQVVSVAQAQALETAGADAIIVGIGGGGRCTTAKLGKLSINWAQLLWKLRGEIGIPVIVQGGGIDNVPNSLAAGASGIGVVGKLAGTIETPGGFLFWLDPDTGEIFKFYGGEASERMKFLSGKQGPFGVIPYPEGETTEKKIRANHGSNSRGRRVLPTALQAIVALMDGSVAGFVFQNASTIAEMQDVGGDRLRKASAYDPLLSNTH